MQTTQDFSSRRQETLKKLPANQKWKLLTQYKGSTLEMLVRNLCLSMVHILGKATRALPMHL